MLDTRKNQNRSTSKVTKKYRFNPKKKIIFNENVSKNILYLIKSPYYSILILKTN